MPDFMQQGSITTLHDLGTTRRRDMEALLEKSTRDYPMALLLPVTGADMRGEAFRNIIQELTAVRYLKQIVVVLNRTRGPEDYREAAKLVGPLDKVGKILWLDGERARALDQSLTDTGLVLGEPGKGRAVWSAIGYLLADPSLHAFALHDCDIVTYDRSMVAKLCLPMVRSGLQFDFCKAYYARFTDRLHGRVVRLLTTPLLQSLIATLGPHPFLSYLNSFRYPLSGEFAITTSLCQYNRIPSDWGLEVGTLAEVFRNTSHKRVCQVDLCRRYDHKHQELSTSDPTMGLNRMTTDILASIFRTLGSMGVSFNAGFFPTVRAGYLRAAQDCIRQYHADAEMNDLYFDRHEEESAIEAFAERIVPAGQAFLQEPTRFCEIPNWNRVLAVFPDFPYQLRDAVLEDAKQFG